jgi:tRNA (cmo5U34)-methyltransferase
MAYFSDPDAAARYGDGPARQVPGFADLQRMVALLLAERLGPEAQLLVLGADGGLELKALAGFRPGWRFTGVDPSAEMLAVAAAVIGPDASRVVLHHGYIDSAPAGPFDGATCLLTLHFVPREDRVPTLSALRARLTPGATLVVAHHSFPQTPAEKALWLARYAAFCAASGVAEDKAKAAARRIGAELPILSPEEDEACLRDAGFADVALFHAGFTFRGWVATAA